jgi:hypothetical protein
MMRQAGLMDLGWIWTDNLRPLLVELSLLVGYGFDDSDWMAVENGVGGTDSEAGPWFEYPVGRIGVMLTLEPGAGEMMSVKFDEASKSEEEKIRWLGDLMRNWHLSDGRLNDGASGNRPGCS